MSTFLDRHSLGDISAAVRQQLRLEAVEGVRDSSGVRSLGHWVEDHAIYCLLDAPDADAVTQHHKARGVPSNDLHAIVGVSSSRPLTESDMTIVRAEIRRLWHATPKV